MTNNPYGVHNAHQEDPLDQLNQAETLTPEDATPIRPRVGLPEGIQHTKPKELKIAYTLLCFFGVFGAHKFYMGQTTHGFIYLVTAFVTLITASISVLVFISFLGLVGLLFATFVDCMTLQEQMERSEAGEKFTPKELIHLAKKAVS